MVEAARILEQILTRYEDADKWVGARFEKIKRLSNTKIGDVGQDFIEELCTQIGFECQFPHDGQGQRKRTSPWDIEIEKVTFELKTATEDTNGNFQFNHVRYHRQYDALLCVGISPEEIRFDAWSKADVATGKAGTLVGMDKDTSATHKLTKRGHQLRHIDEFEDRILDIAGDLSE